MTIEERLEQLEREVASLREEVRTKKLILEDEKGEIRALLDVDEDGVSLSLRDEEDETRAVLSYMEEGGPSLSLWERDEKIRSMLGVNEAGTYLSMWDENGALRAQLGLNREGHGQGLSLYDEKGVASASLLEQFYGSALWLSNENGEVCAEFAICEGEPMLSMLDEKGVTRTMLNLDEEGAKLSLWDENGELCERINAFKDGPRDELCEEKDKTIVTTEQRSKKREKKSGTDILRGLLAPKEVKVAFQILNELSLEFDFPAFEKIKRTIKKNLFARRREFVALVRRGTSPREWVFGSVANLAADLVESGHYHIYRGALDPFEGEGLLRLLHDSLDELVRLGAMDASFASGQKQAVRRNIEDVG